MFSTDTFVVGETKLYVLYEASGAQKSPLLVLLPEDLDVSLACNADLGVRERSWFVDREGVRIAGLKEGGVYLFRRGELEVVANSWNESLAGDHEGLGKFLSDLFSKSQGFKE